MCSRFKVNVKEIKCTLCKYKRVDIVVGAVYVDYVHLSVNISPEISVFGFIGHLKGKIALMIGLLS